MSLTFPYILQLLTTRSKLVPLVTSGLDYYGLLSLLLAHRPLTTMVATHVSMLTAIDARSHVHLVIGSNPLAAARCGQSIASGSRPVLVAPETAELHYALQKRVDDGEVHWVKKKFEDSDLFSLGRPEIEGIVDAVFVTSGPRDPQSTLQPT